MEGHKELIALESDRFKRYLAKLFYDNNNNNNNNNNNRSVSIIPVFNNAIQIVQANIEYDGQTIPLSLRVACHNCKQRGDKWFMQKHSCLG